MTVANRALDRPPETLSVCREVRQEFRIENQKELKSAYRTDMPDTIRRFSALSQPPGESYWK